MSLPLARSHFAAALLFFVGGALLLVWSAPDLATGSFLSPRVIGATHLFTLGWITTSIMGALYLLLPDVVGPAIRWPGVGWLTLLVHVPGLAVFVVGLVTVRPGLTIAGASAVSFGVVLFSVNVGSTLRRARPRDPTWWALASAVFFLTGTMVLGGAMAANLAWPYLGVNRLTALVTHLHVGLVGWAVLAIVGLAQRTMMRPGLAAGEGRLPAASEGRLPAAPDGRVPVALLGVGTMTLFALHHAPGSWARWLPAGIMVGGMAAAFRQAFQAYRRRNRSGPVPGLGSRFDPGFGLGAAALGLMAAATVVGGVLAYTGFSRPTIVVAYVGSVVLGISLFVAAAYYTIVAGDEPFAARATALAGALMVAGCVLLLGSIAGGIVVGVRTGAALLAAGAAVEALQMARCLAPGSPGRGSFTLSN